MLPQFFFPHALNKGQPVLRQAAQIRLFRNLSVHLFSAKIHIRRLIVAEALMLCCQKVVVKNKEVRVLAGLNGTLCIFYAKGNMPLSAAKIRRSKRH